MLTRFSENAPGRDGPLAANMVPVSLHAEMHRAFQEWLDASEAWSALRGTLAANGESVTGRRRLEELEQRVDIAARAFEQAKRRCSDSPLYTAMLFAAIARAPRAAE